MRKILIICGAVSTLLLGACVGDSSRPQATGEGRIRAVNTIPTAPAILTQIEERVLANVDYAGISNPATFDDLLYNFNFEVTLAGDLLRTRIATYELKMEKDVFYTLVASGDLNAPDISHWEKPIREWEGTETVFEAQFAHTAESLGAIDIYFAAPGVAPAAGQEIGTLSFGEILPVADYPGGDYVYTMTSSGNPGDILFTSSTITPDLATGFIISVFDGTADDPGEYSVKIFFDGGFNTSVLSDAVPPTVRFIHANATIGATDIYTDELLMDQILGGHAYRDVSGDIDLATAAYPFTYTAAGNAGSVLVEQTLIIPGALRSQIYLLGDDSSPVLGIRIPERRSVETEVKFNFLHAAVNHPLVDLYIVDAGTDITDEDPTFFRVGVGQSPPTINTGDGDKELYLTTADEKTIISGPVSLTIAYGDVYEYVSFDNVDPATADLVEIPLP